jgi:hypothetical protein
MKDFFTGSQFENEFGEVWNVEEVLAYAKTKPEYYFPNLDVDMIKHDLSYHQGDMERTSNADTSFPILVIQYADGSLTIADGLNRTYKAIYIEDKTHLPAYVIPEKSIAHLKTN